jgi:hypothetical protein
MYGMDLSALKDNASATQSFLDFQFQTPDMGTDNFFFNMLQRDLNRV